MTNALAEREQVMDETTSASGTAVQRMTPDVWSMLKEQSITLEQAGKGTSILPKGITNRYQINAILQKGWELGFGPMYSLEQIGIVNGKPVVQSQALTATIQRHHGRRAVRILETTDEKATVRFEAPGVEPLDITWTIKDAERAGLTKKGGPWAQYPRTMLRWRAIAEGARLYFADTIAGLFLPDEIGVAYNVDSTGNLVFDRGAESTGETTALLDAEDIEDATFIETTEAPTPKKSNDVDLTQPPPTQTDADWIDTKLNAIVEIADSSWPVVWEWATSLIETKAATLNDLSPGQVVNLRSMIEKQTNGKTRGQVRQILQQHVDAALEETPATGGSESEGQESLL